ncbi:hypothetical protein MRS76_01660 [Rhizobiaceae bacterium n13]|uniref:Capsular polysaccharide transport system permease protein n=1 Tax=Ferirhizobium litorale TaxID=2927786 RepID=A0AAE3QB91_9HYPH|nr:hypothetical protein [Fererhizobium litorale]MDI7860650.1 hypothetical protein [Fererhizobium litorale]MDI7920798.1 hypothetical protein [Fererhizobium litorale]
MDRDKIRKSANRGESNVRQLPPREQLLKRREVIRRRRLKEMARISEPAPDDLDDDLELLEATDTVAVPTLTSEEPHPRDVPWGPVLFFLSVLLPTAIVGLYFAFIASPQYEVESQFSVRGVSESSMSSLGLSVLTGMSGQSGDSYIVSSYIASSQLYRDIKEKLDIDLREFYAQDSIDFVYRIDRDMPPEEFAEYWRDMINISYNSTTGNVVLQVYAFSAPDAKVISDAVLKVSESLVNTLSENSRQQLVQVANQQVERSEARLQKIRDEISAFREQEQTFDPKEIASLEAGIVSSLEGQLAALKTRQRALLETVSGDAPSAKVIERQITALESQLDEQRAKVGSGEAATDGSASVTSGDERRLPQVFTRYEELTVEQGFATTAYTTSLAALETALGEAQKQQRYFATYVHPTEPAVALYPRAVMSTFVAFLIFLFLWVIGYFAVRSIRDHAI